MCDLFRRSYGERSPFSSVGFARAYFECRREEGTKEQLNSFIGLRIRDGEVVAHYGVRPQWFRWGGQRFLLGWGVNAITSADHRGKGLGAGVFEAALGAFPDFGVIGFTEKTADFYDARGFQLFDRRRYDRHFLPLRGAALEWVSQELGEDVLARMHRSLEQVSALSAGADETGVLLRAPSELRDCSAPFSGLQWHRTASELALRFYGEPHLSYDLWQSSGAAGAGSAFVAVRREEVPDRSAIWRCVDLAGDAQTLAGLLRRIIRSAIEGEALALDVLTFGEAYREVLAEVGFVSLTGEQVAGIPLVFQPPEYRPNREYVGLWLSRSPGVAVDRVHLTRAASDRDRLGRMAAT